MERKLKSHGEFSKGEKGRLQDVLGENISWVALAFDTVELEHAVVDGLWSMTLIRRRMCAERAYQLGAERRQCGHAQRPPA